MQKPIYLILAVMCLGLSAPGTLSAQDETNVEISAVRSGDTYEISIDPDDLPELQGDGSGNEPYYSYYWEFGDYRFAHSVSPSVEHQYSSAFVNREVEVRLYFKAHYALSPKIVREPLHHTFTVQGGADQVPFENVPEGLIWMSSSDFSPTNEIPGDGENGGTTHQIQEREDFVMIISVKNPPNRNLAGSTLDLHIPKYHDFFIYKGHNLDNGLASLQTELEPERRLPSRLSFGLNDFGNTAGTNIFLYLTPRSSGKKPPFGKTIEIEMELSNGGETWDETIMNVEVVESRDPNRLLVSTTYVQDWKEFFNKGLTYRVDFQNYGTGTVENGIMVFIDLPEGADPSTFQLLGHHSAACSSINPALSPCDTIIDRSGKDQVIVNLDDAGLLSQDADEKGSKGFITYNIKPKRSIGKCPWKSRAAVQFTSARRLARTNRISTDFKSSFSLGVKTMYNWYPGEAKANYYSLGLVLGSDLHCRSDSRLSVMFGVEKLDSLFQDIGNYYVDIAFTPIRIDPIRFQNGNWNLLGIGVGAQFSMAFREQVNENDIKRANSWTGYGDITLVSRRKGPRIGFQYHVPIAVRNFPEDASGSVDFKNTHWQFYFTWAF